MTTAELPYESDAPARWKPVGLLAVSHSLVDLCQGMVPALLTFLVSEGRLNYKEGAGLVFATASVSSVIQPLFGHLADRFSWRWLLPSSLLLTAVGVCLGAQSPSYTVFFLALCVSGLGVAAFHPEAARQVHRLARPGRAAEMSVFAVGGSIGFAAAPLVTNALLAAMGNPGIFMVFLPTAILTILLAFRITAAPTAKPSGSAKTTNHPAADGDLPGFLTLCVVTICRSILFVGFNTFLALYWIRRWSVDAPTANTLLAAFLGIGVCGTLLGGWLADRLGNRAILRSGFAVAGVLLPVLLLMPDRQSATIILPFLAIAFYIPSSILVVLGQAYLPHRIGVASGVTLGLGVSAGGMVALPLGWVADNYGVETVLLVLEGVLIAAVVLSLALPRVPRLFSR